MLYLTLHIGVQKTQNHLYWDIIGVYVFLMFSSTSISPYAMQIMLGEHDVRVFEGTEQLMKTDTIIWHPEWAEIFLSSA